MLSSIKKHRKLYVSFALGLIVFYFGFSIYAANLLTSRLSPHLDISPKFVSENWRSVEFKSSDGIKLRGWFFSSWSNKVIIMVGGLMANRTNSEYMGSIIAKELLAKGYNVLLYDTRAHGKSDGNRVAFGSIEGKDIIGAVRYLKNLSFPAQNIGIIADSTGATSTIMVIDQLNDVGAIVVDTPAANFSEIISRRLWEEKFVPGFFHPTIFFFAKFLFKTDLTNIKPINKIELDPSRKLLFLHGLLDKTIPISNSKQLLQKANTQSKLVIFEQGNHIETFKTDPDLYRKEVFHFLESELKK